MNRIPVSSLNDKKSKVNVENPKCLKLFLSSCKNKMFEKGEIPLGMGRFSKAFSEYYEESKSGSVRIWSDIDFKLPSQ